MMKDSDSLEEENERTARRMELIRIMLYKFQQRKLETMKGSENQHADYASTAALMKKEGGVGEELLGRSGGAARTTAISPTYYSPIGTTLGMGRRSPSLGSKIIDAELN